MESFYEKMMALLIVVLGAVMFLFAAFWVVDCTKHEANVDGCKKVAQSVDEFKGCVE